MAHVNAVTTSQLRELPLFAAWSESELARLLALGSVRSLKAKERLSKRAPSSEENFAFVVDGTLAILLERPGAADGRPGAAEPAGEYVGYFEKGDGFSDGFRLVPREESDEVLDCVAVSHAVLFQLPSAALRELLAGQAAFRAEFTGWVQAARARFLSHQSPAERVVQDFFLREGYATGSVARAVRLDLCIDCNKCQDACAARHGTARMVRVGRSLGRLSFPVVCRTCVDKPCLSVCKAGCLLFDEAAGSVRILEGCTGCGACVKRCPSDAIAMESYRAAEGLRKRAIKCDHCAGYSEQACLVACPTQALIELSPAELFLESSQQEPVAHQGALGARSARSTRFSEAPFLLGRSGSGVGRPSWWAQALTVAAFVVLAGLGLEAFLRRTQPEHSLTALILSLFGSSSTVSYSSGRGLGHVLGYTGFGAMLASVLYSLRTRVKGFAGLGSQRVWLSAHLWLGFTGATLVTYHSALKLDRWAGIACFLMWFVIATGAIGRYVYGRAHSGMNLAEFELRAERRRCLQWVSRLPGNATVAALVGVDSEVGRQRSLWVVLWQEVRDRVRLFLLGRSTVQLLPDAAERRALLADLAAWSASRRRSSYLGSAKRVLRYWNIVHIVLAIAMFILAAIHVVYGFLYKAV